MSLTLKDLRKWGSPTYGYSDEVTLADLVEVLKQEGVLARSAFPEDGFWSVSVEGPGSYLVLPLEDTP